MSICREKAQRYKVVMKVRIFLRGVVEMTKTSGCRLVLLVGLLILCGGVGGCASQDSCPQKPVSQWLVSPELLAHSGLEMLWRNKLPIRENENLERLIIVGNRIYAFSDYNYMVSLNREKGNVIFSRPIARAGFPVLGLELYENELFSIVGNKLVEIDSQSGAELSARRLPFGVTCPAARNNSYFYIAGSDRRVHTLRADDKVWLFEVAAESDSTITSIIADERFVVFATDAGDVISIAPDRPKRLWQFNAADSIVEPIVRDAESLFVASKDTNVYKVDIFTGKLVWKYPAGEVLKKGPLVTREVVYQYVGEKGLAAIDKKSGDALWQLANGVDLLAEADGKAYVITSTGKLVVMDNKKAEQLYSVNFAGVSRYATNAIDSKIYIADESGRIACLRPIE